MEMETVTMNPLLNRRQAMKTLAGGTTALAAGHLLGIRPAAADAVTIEFWNPANDELGGPIIKKLVDEYNLGAGAEQGITANNVVSPTPSGYDKYTTAMASSASPDVVMTYSYTPVVPWIANGFVQPLDEYFPALGLKQDDFYPVIWQAMTFGGKVYGFFQEFDFDEMYWNTDIDDGELPKTIAEFDELCAEYTQFDANGNLTQAGIIPWAQGGFSAGGYGTWATIMGARFYDVENRKFTITRPENAAFLEWYLTYVEMLGDREKADAFVSALPKTFWGDVFLFGKTAFGMQFEAMPEIIRQVGDGTLQYKIGHPPEVPGVTKETTQIISADVFLVPAKSRHAPEAAAFATYMSLKRRPPGLGAAHRSDDPGRQDRERSATLRQPVVVRDLPGDARIRQGAGADPLPAGGPLQSVHGAGH